MSKSPGRPTQRSPTAKANLVMADLSDNGPVMTPKAKGTARKRAASAAPGAAEPSLSKRPKGSAMSPPPKTSGGSQTGRDSTPSRHTRATEAMRQSLPPPSPASPVRGVKLLKRAAKADGIKLTGKAKAANDGGKPHTASKGENVNQAKDADEAGTIIQTNTTNMADKANDDTAANSNNETVDKASHGTVPSANAADEANSLDDAGNQGRVFTFLMPEAADAASGVHRLNGQILNVLSQYKAHCHDDAKINIDKAAENEKKWAESLHTLNDQAKLQARKTLEAKEINCASAKDVETKAEDVRKLQEALECLQRLEETPYALSGALENGRANLETAEGLHAEAKKKADDDVKLLEKATQREQLTTNAALEAEAEYSSAKKALQDRLQTKQTTDSACEFMGNISAIINLGIDGTKELGDMFPELFETAKSMAEMKKH
ncbi:hypothetical protein CEP54_014808 [Fusarium duplospermum]|uniref:Uncharacterized protein n=1 Tax=Fusarium duplospermum TaxID=1325734 RepID=A0A428NTK1_9HYPO|nr:hypothetical protein CEP54_014808 [Fusarium duplospermum]